MKRVLTASEVAHTWAHQLQSDARTAQNNFYFNGDTIYSYGSHFPIAKILPDGKVLMTLRTYSNTTTKQVGLVRSAVSHMEKLYCYDINSNYTQGNYEHQRNIARWVANIEGNVTKLQTARKPEKYIDAIKAEIAQLNAYTSYFNVELSEEQKTLLSIGDSDGFKELAHKRQEAKKAELKRIEELGKPIYLRYCEAWRENKVTELSELLSEREKADGNKYTRAIGDKLPTLLRVNGTELETSKGIKMSIEVAHRFYKWWLSKCENPCTDCGYKMLNYEVTRANKDGLVVGCHNIPASEIQLISIKLGW